MRIAHKLLPVVCSLAIGLVACTAARADTAIGLLGTFGSRQVSFPYGVAVDQETGVVYVGSTLSEERGGVGKFDSTGELQFKFGPPSGFFAASGVAVDPVNHDVYVVAAFEQEIQTYDPSSKVSSENPLSKCSVSGSGRETVFEVPATQEQIAADSAGNIYFPNAPNNEVQVFSPTCGAPGGGIVTPITGSGGDALSKPGGVAVNSAGDIYVADTGNGRVEEFEPSGAFVMAIGAGVNKTEHERLGLEPGETTQEKEAKENVCTAASGDTCGPGTDDTQAVAVDSSTGDIYALDVAGSGYHVVEYDSAGTQLADFGSGEIGKLSEFGANTLAVDSTTGDVYVTSDTEEPGEIFGHVVIFGEVTIPHAETGSATNGPALAPPLPPTSEQLSGTVTAFGTATTFHFEYGTTTEYGSSSPVPSASAGSGYLAQPETTILSGLEGSTTYHYRLVASNGGGSSFGEDQTFTTPAAAPAVGYTPSSDVVTQTTATLAGTVDAESQPTTYQFEYVDANDYNPEAPDPYSAGGVAPEPEASAGSGSGPQPVSQPLNAVLAPNTLYHYRLVATNATETTDGPDQTFTTLPSSPLLTPGQPSSLTDSSVTLEGLINPQGAYTTYQFNYGETSSYGASTPKSPAFAGSDSNNVPVSANLTGLTPNTTYHYQLTATAANPGGSTAAESPDENFTTLAAPPWVSTDPATQIGSTSATLAGSVTPLGAPTTYDFAYGTSTAYGASAPAPEASAGSGTSAEQETLDLTGLQPGTTYHYRIVATATNSVGATTIAAGPDQTFVTSTEPSTVPTGNPFSPGTSTLPTLTTIPLLSTPTFPPPPAEVTTPTKPLTKAQKLAKALKACKKDKLKKKRATCEKQARRKYASKPKAKK